MVEKRRYKIKSRIQYEKEIDEERKNVTINSFCVGTTALSSILCFSSAFGAMAGFEERIGLFCLGIVSVRGVIGTAKVLTESLSRKIKLENDYNLYSRFESFDREESRGRRV